MSCVTTLKAKGLKLTPQRRVIIDLFDHNGEHITADEVISHVQSRMPGVNKSTIYRTLDLLESVGCVYRSSLGEQVVYHHADDGHHHHLVCIRCGRTTVCDEDVLAPVSEALRRAYGFHADFKHLVMSGVCEDCAAGLA